MTGWRWLCLGLVLTGSAPAEWGAGATFPADRAAWAGAAWRAATDPFTWVPALVGAVVFASGEDESLSDRAMTNAPVFGSPEEASERSDELRTYINGLWIASMLLTDSGAAPIRNKSRGILVQAAAVNVTLAVSNALKKTIDRDEPGQEGAALDGDAFPSNHATAPFAQAALVRRNLRATGLQRGGRALVNTAAYLLATGSAWGRVEAGIHHVSDQFGGAALGNFIALTINDALMGDSNARLSFLPRNGGAQLSLNWRY